MSAPPSPIRGVQDDDLLLDRIGRREHVDDHGVGGVLQAWVATIDADATNLTAPAPVMRVPEGQETVDVEPLGAARPRSATGRLIRLSGSRLAAAAATAALVSGAGVAAALNGHEVPGVSTLLRTVGAPLPEATPSGTPVEATATGAGDDVSATLARSRRLLAAGEVRKAKELVDEVRLQAMLIPDLMLEVTEIDKAIDSSSPTGVPTPAPVVPTPGQGPGTGTGAGPAPTGGGGGDSSAPATSDPGPSSDGTGTTEPTTPPTTGESTPDPEPAPTTGAGDSGNETGSPQAEPSPKAEEGSGGSAAAPGDSGGAAAGEAGDRGGSVAAGSADGSGETSH